VTEAVQCDELALALHMVVLTSVTESRTHVLCNCKSDSVPEHHSATPM